MNIEQIMDNNKVLAVSSDNKLKNIHGIRDYSFELEFPENETFDDYLQPVQDSANIQSDKSLEDIEAELISTLKNLAQKDNIPFQFKNIREIRLLIRSMDIHQFNDDFSLKLDKLTEKDLDFLKETVKNQEISFNPANFQNFQVNIPIQDQSGNVSYKSFDVSKGLSNLIEYAYKTQRPIRMDFEGNSSVILKIDKEGKLSAEFVSSDTAMEYLLRTNIPNLRNKLDSEGIPYKEILYKENKKKQNNREHKGD